MLALAALLSLVTVQPSARAAPVQDAVVWLEGTLVMPPRAPVEPELEVPPRAPVEPELEVRVLDGAAPVGSTARPDAEGRFRLAFDAGAPRWEVGLSAHFLRLAEPLVLDPGAPGELVLAPELGARVIGRVVPPEGFTGSFAGKQVELSLMPIEGALAVHELHVELGDDLAFAFDGLPHAHEASVRATLEPFQSDATEWFELRRGQEVEIELVLRSGCTLRGRVVYEDGSPAADVLVRRAGGGEFRAGRDETRSAQDGTFQLGPLHSGAIELSARKAGIRARWETHDAQPGAVLEGIELVLRAVPEIRGVVRFPDGTPAAGARLDCDDAAKRLTSGILEQQGVGSIRTTRVKSDADGSFRLEVEDAQAYALRARLDDGALAFGAVREGVVAGQEVVLVLERLPVLDGTVVDDAGEPIEAGLLLVQHPGEMWPETSAIAGGRFHHVLETSRDGPWLLVVQAEGHPASRPRRVVLGEADLELVCPRAVELSVRVLDEAGQPLARARVSVEPAEEDFDEQSYPLGRTNAAGLAVGRPPLAGAVRVRARLGDELRGNATVFLAPGGSSVEVAVERRASLEGRAFLPNGKPAKRYAVDCQAARGSAYRDAECDRAGNFRMDDLEPGEYRVALLDDELNEIEGVDCTLAAGESLTLELRAKRPKPVRVRGRVLAGGAPAAEKGVSLSSYEIEGEEVGAETDANGAFELVAPFAGRFVLDVWDDDVLLERLVDLPASAEHELAIEFPDGSIEGRVLDERGTPLAGVPVSLVAELDGGSEAVSYADVVTDGQGVFRFVKLAPDRYRFGAGGFFATADRRDASRGGRVVADVALAAGEHLAGFDLVLVPATTERGVVRDEHGEPVADAFVHGRDENGCLLADEPLAVTDELGRFEIAGLVAGRDVLIASALFQLARPVPVASEGELALVLEPASMLLLSIGGPDGGKALEAWRVRDAQGGEVPPFAAFEAVSGLWETTWGPVHPGVFRVRCRSAFGTAEREVEVALVPETHVVLDFPR